MFIPLKLIFLVVTVLVVILGALINWAEPHLPQFIVSSYRYGKMASSGQSWSIQVPKRWFQHFYVFAALGSSVTFLLSALIYFGVLSSAPSTVLNFLDIFDTNRIVMVNQNSAFLAAFLLLVQTWKRMYETQRVSVFSNGKIDITQYFLGYLHYFACMVAVTTETPGFTWDQGRKTEPLTKSECVAALVFLVFWAAQHHCAILLSSLRKDSKGKIVSTKHKIPTGGLFEVVSSPHFLCEIIMYLCLWVILWGNSLYPYILFWVISNQVEVALLTHWWYKKQFKNYPKQRKAIIPWVL